MAEHKHGSMNIEEQERTFAAFINWTMRIGIGIIVFLVLLALVNG